MQVLSWLGRCLARYLEGAARSTYAHAASDLLRVGQALEPADVLLVDGKRRISVAIKYLTHSHWSHAALYVGPRLGSAANGEALSLVEADAVEGVRAVALSEYAGHRLRICRPRGLSEVDREKVPADFDNSPYFDIVKPELSAAFDYRRIPWAETPQAAAASMVLKEAAVGGAESSPRT